MINSWYAELWRILLVAAVSALLGAAVDDYVLGLLAGALVYLGWHVYGLARLDRWLREYDSAQIPTGSGIWGQVYDRLRRLDRQHDQEIEGLRQRVERYRQTTKALPEGAVTLGPNDEIELINETASALLGLREPQDLGSTITNLVRDPEFVQYMRAVRTTASCEPLEIVSPVNPSVRLSIRIVAHGVAGRLLLLVCDVSRLHKLEEIRRDFIANVSHEMKSPLTVIKGYVESMLDDKDEFGLKWEKALTQIDQQSERMCRIVEDLLELSSLETGPVTDPVAVDVPALIRSVYREALELDDRRHQIRLDIDEQLHLLGDCNQLYGAFSNILFNAIRYTPEGGDIGISWLVDVDQVAKFSVTDAGPGIADEHIPRLTERFYRVDTARSRDLGGTGLGLAIVKHVLLRHDATLAVASEVGAGSTFTCVFPPSRIASATAQPVERRA